MIKALVGDWQGSYEWIGKNQKGPMNARYYLTGNGTAVVEDLIVDGNANMTTVYHLHGADLRATHYCAAGNQPRLKATPTEDDNKVVKFHMVDITNLPTPRRGPCQRSRAAIDQCHGISDQLASELPLLMGFPPIPVLATRLS